MPARNKKKKEIPDRSAHYEKLCRKCGARCCNHIALEMDKPTTKAEYDHIRWFLFHKGVKVFIDHDGSWNLEVAAACEALKGSRCTAYEVRPNICRDYPGQEDECEFEDPDRLACKKVFTSVPQFERWMKRNKIDWRPDKPDNKQVPRRN